MSDFGRPSLSSKYSHPGGLGDTPLAGKRLDLVAAIDDILPQTQCTQCGFSGCKPYAEAIARGEADINQCPPGGEHGIHALAELLHVPYKPLNPLHGVHKPKALAVIEESMCIGCTLCIQACPVDAILGAAKQMHTVIQDECTGCELCLAPCPVDCIRMELHPQPILDKATRKRARTRHEFRLYRLEREKQERAERQARRAAAHALSADDPAQAAKKAAIAAAMERVRAQKEQAQPRNNDNLSHAVAGEIAAIDARRAMTQQVKAQHPDTPSAEMAVGSQLVSETHT